MPFLMHIAFNNPFRLKGDVHYFEYKGVRFKLVQNNPHRWSDVLLTIVDSPRSPSVEMTYAVAGEFASALSWEYRAGIGIHYIGGPGIREGFGLRQAGRGNVRVFPTVPFRGMVVGHDLSRIARITTDQQRTGLTLFREARSANKLLLSLLLNWQILEIKTEPAGWVEKTVRRKLGELGINEAVKELRLGPKRLGDYLRDDCRDAIAHIRRKPGKRKLRFDSADEDLRLGLSARITEALARYYIEYELGVTDSLYLVRKRGRGFPTYLDSDTIHNGWYTSARGRRRHS
jgi:hypothetical protein